MTYREHDFPTVDANDLLLMICYCIDLQIPLWIWGPPGIGKSEIALMGTTAMARQMVPLNLQFFERVDLAGAPTVQGGRTQWNPPAMFPADGDPVIFWDEANTAPIDVQAVMFPAIRENRIGDFRLPASTAHLAAGNEAKHRAAAKRTATALNNRFAHARLESSNKAFFAWGTGTLAAEFVAPPPCPPASHASPMHPDILAFLRLRPHLLAPDLWANPDVVAFPSPRTWELVTRAMRVPVRRIRDLIIVALVGTAGGYECLAFLDQMAHIPDPRAILADPDAAAIPGDDKPGARYALAMALANMATVGTVDAILRYVERMSPDYAVLCGHQIKTTKPELQETAAYCAHVVKYQTTII